MSLWTSEYLLASKKKPVFVEVGALLVVVSGSAGILFNVRWVIEFI